MELRKVLALRGPNIWANFPVLEVWVDLGALKDTPSHEIPGFNDRLINWLPTLIEHRCSLGERGGFLERLRRGTYLAHVLEHATLELLSLSGAKGGFGRARETSEEGVFKVAIQYDEDESVAKECLLVAREMVMAAIDDRPFDVAGEVRRLRSFAQRTRLGPSTQSIVSAARARGIPYRRLNEGSLVQFGYGSRQRRICAAETDRTSSIAEGIAQDKELTRKLLQAAGVPVPRGRPVDSAEDAWRAAEGIGVPVVVKPQDGNQGRGVATNLSTREQVLAAYEAAHKESDSIIVEKFAPGNDYRVLIVGGRLVAAARREPARVVGDGAHTIAELVEIVNLDPRRGEDHATSLSKLRLDEIALGVLADQGLTPQSVPATGAIVNIRRNANLSTGGTAIDVTELVHPEVATRCIEAAAMIGLDIAGVDVVATEIGRPLEEQSGVIVEVNAAPGLRMHLEPSAGVSRPVGEAIVATLYPPGENGRIPIAAVTGVNGKTTTTRFIAHILQGTGRRVGMTCTDGIYIDERRVDNEDCAGPQSAANVLMNPRVDAAVLETARGGVLRAGLGFDRCDVAVVTNICEGDHLGLSYVETLEVLAKVKRVIVDVVQPTGYAVLNAADPLVSAMAPECPGKVVFFARDPAQPVLVAHRQSGGRAIFVRDGSIVIADGDREETILPLDRVPLTHRGRIGFQIENALAAIAAAWSLGVPLDVIRTRVELFAANLEQSPGRFNLLEINGATVIIDYGHNSSALLALIEAIEKLPHQRRTIVYSTAGDRRDCDITRQGEIIGQNFDRAILFEDHYLRGRKEGEIIGLLRQGLSTAARARQVDEIRGALAAVEAGLNTAQPGDLVVVQADTIDETVQYIHRYLKSLATRTPVNVPETPAPKAPSKSLSATPT